MRRYVLSVPTPSALWFFVGASIALLLIPGPAVLYIVARSSRQGTRAGLVSVGGVHAASARHVLAAVAGLSAVLVASSIAFTATKIAGGIYLIVLGLRSLQNARRAPLLTSGTDRPERQLFIEAFVVNLFNPKVALFFLAFLPQFVTRGHGSIWLQTMMLGAVYILLGLCTDSIYAVLGARVGSWFNGRTAKLRAARYAEGTVLVGLGVATLALPHRRFRR